LNIRKLLSRPKLYFLVVTPLLLATALIKIECPVCDGSGSIIGSVGMERVIVVTMEDRIIDSIQDACSGYVVTKARPVITVNNIGSDVAAGWLKINLVNLETKEELAVQYLPVEVSPSATSVLQSLLVFAFYSADIPPQNIGLKAEPLTGTVPDTVCGGTGKVTLNSYLLARAYQDKLVSLVQSEHEFGPDLSHGEPGSQEWLDWWELN
jgi:hypothetical protein